MQPESGSDAYVTLQTDAFSAHQQVIARCRGARSVLDVGCSSGEIAAEVTRRFGAVVDGIEADPEAAAAAAHRCRRVLTGDVDAMDLTALEGAHYDVIVLADILEHLAEPGRALQRLTPLLAADGRLVISTPNVANWSIRLLLLAGRWDYNDRGILDRTHLHLFTRRTLLDMLGGSGFRVEEMDVTCPLPVLRREPFTRWAHGAARARPTLLAYQFIVTARRDG